jgi:hypothetical protein
MSPNKNKKQTLILLTLLTILTLLLTTTATENQTTQCSDNIDNDNDGLTDLQDPACITPDHNDEIDCYMNTDCGIDTCAGDANYCDDNDVYQIFLFNICNNPGQNNATCSTHTDPFLIFDCGESYCEEYTENYCHQDNLYKNRICHNKGCADKDCFTEQTNQETLIKKCQHGCKNNKCKSKETGKWRDYPTKEPEIQKTTPPSNFTFIQEQLQKTITIPNKKIIKQTSNNNWIIIFTLLITAILIFILVSLTKPN